jgi:small conductance mechanosensitive channel
MNAFLDSVLARLEEMYNPETLGTRAAEWMADAVVFVLAFLGFVLFWMVVRRLLRPALRRTRMDETTLAFTETILKYTILVVGLLSALSAAGINTSSVLASLGIAGLTIGFAARDAFSNLISGLFIFIDRPFVIGDLVEIDGNYGRVDQITLRSTRIITSDGKMLAVPSSEIINKTVASYTNFPHLRLDVDVTVAVDEELDRVRRVLLDIVRDDPVFMTEPPPRVVITALNDYNIAVALQAWIYDERLHVEERFELREKIFKALTAAGVNMPLETIQLAPVAVRRLEPPQSAPG